jgi:AbrB family looped-hinge helix DNA binding protein
MLSVTISPKYQVVIPSTIRRHMGLKPGQKMQVIEYGQRIELIPELNLADLRGGLKGLNISEYREKEDNI